MMVVAVAMVVLMVMIVVVLMIVVMVMIVVVLMIVVMVMIVVVFMIVIMVMIMIVIMMMVVIMMLMPVVMPLFKVPVQICHVVIMPVVHFIEDHIKITAVYTGLLHSSDRNLKTAARDPREDAPELLLIRAQIQERRNGHISADPCSAFQIQNLLITHSCRIPHSSCPPYGIRSSSTLVTHGQTVDLCRHIARAVSVVDIDDRDPVRAGIDHRHQRREPAEIGPVAH